MIPIRLDQEMDCWCSELIRKLEMETLKVHQMKYIFTGREERLHHKGVLFLRLIMPYGRILK